MFNTHCNKDDCSTRAFSLIFSNLSGCTVQNIQQTKKCKFNHSVKLAICWEDYPWEVNVAFPLHFHLSVPLAMVVAVWGSKGCWWTFLQRDSCLTGTQRCSGWWPYLLWPVPLWFIERIFAQTVFWGRKQGLAKMGPRSSGSQRGADAATVVRNLQGGSLGHPYVSPPLTPSQCYAQDSLGLPKPWPTRFLIPESQLIYLLSISGIFRPFVARDHNQIYPN